MTSINSEISIRPFNEDDFSGIAAVGEASPPGPFLSADDIRHIYANRDNEQLMAWFVAVDSEGEIVGSGFYAGQLARQDGDGDPEAENEIHTTFTIFCYVYPSLQGRGIGSNLYETVLAVLEPYRPYRLRTDMVEGQEQTLRFLVDRGFLEINREQESHLDIASFDSDKFAPELKRVKDQGIVIESVAGLGDDPDRDFKLYELSESIHRDIPSGAADAPRAKTSFASWRDSVWSNPRLLPDAWFIAIDDSAYIGQSQFVSYEGSEL